MVVFILIPTYNERDNIVSLLEKIFSIVPDVNVIIIDGNSNDGTIEELKKYSKKKAKLVIIKQKSKNGIAKAYLDGFKEAIKRKAEYIIQMDADFSHDPNNLPIMIDLLKKNDFVIGSRYTNGISVVNWPLRRILLSYFSSFYIQFVTGMKIKDPTGGFNGYRASLLDEININKIRSEGYIFQTEMKYIFWKLKKKIVEFPIIFVDRHAGTSKMNTSIIFEAFVQVLFFRFKNIKKILKK